MRATAPSIALLASLLLTSCSGSSNPTAARVLAQVTGIVVPAVIRGDVRITVTLTGESDVRYDIRAEVSRDGGRSWYRARIKEGGTGLDAAPDGRDHLLVWDSLADAGFRGTAGSLLRLRSELAGRLGEPRLVKTAPADNRAVAARGVQSYMAHYGAFDASTVATAKQHDLVILHPFSGDVPARVVHDIQRGVDPEDPADDVIVLAYISVGEDLRTVPLTDAQLLLDARFVGDASGPRIDPRGPNADGKSLLNLDPLGSPSNGGTGYASFYLDDNSVDRDPRDRGDGKPDRNGFFGGCFVNAGDPKWFQVLDAMRFDGPDGLPGLRELLTADTGRGYGCDGVFLDTIDTCAPNSFTDGNSGNQSEFEWTAPGFARFIERLAASYPRAFILQNRGLFFYDPRQPHYRVNPRPHVDFLLFESFRLNSNSFEEFHPLFYPDNRNNIAPKLLAEANRSDGFRVLSLGYAEGPKAKMDKRTLLGQSRLGFDSLIADIAETHGRLGFRHYLTDAGVAFPNTFVRDHLPADSGPPVWTSTYNDNERTWPAPPGEPTPRVGVQRVEPGPECATVFWDVAIDSSAVHYTLYYSQAPFDFDADPDLARADRLQVTPQRAADYGPGYGPAVVANQASVTGLETGRRYWFCVRARDALGNEEKNRVVLSAVPMGFVAIRIDGRFDDWTGVPVASRDPADSAVSAGPDWLELAVANDADHLFIRFTSEHAFNLDGSPRYSYSRTLLMIDVDKDPATGYALTSAVGTELLIAGAELFKQKRGTFNDGRLQALSAAPKTGVQQCEIAIPLSRLRAVVPDVRSVRIVAVNDETWDWAPDAGSTLYRIATR